jgi:hypothetical protein
MRLLLKRASMHLVLPVGRHAVTHPFPARLLRPDQLPGSLLQHRKHTPVLQDNKSTEPSTQECKQECADVTISFEQQQTDTKRKCLGVNVVPQHRM